MSNDTASVALYRERSATDVINATFRFLRAQFGPLVKGLLLLAGPPLILANVASMFVTGSTAADPAAAGLGLVQGLGTLFGTVIGMAAALSAVRIVHDEGPSALTTQRLWDATRTHGLSLFGRLLQIGLIFGVGGVVAGGIIGGVAAGAGGLVGGVLAGLLGLLTLGGALYLAPALSLLLPGQVDAERSISISRCLTLMKGRWGQTLGVWLLASIINFILFSVGWIPKVVMMGLSTTGANVTGTVGLVLAGVVAGVANALSPAVIYTATTLQYYNLIEQKEQVSLQDEVDRMEQSARTDTTDAATAASPAAGATLAEGDAEAADGGGAGTSSSGSTAGDEDRRWQGSDQG